MLSQATVTGTVEQGLSDDDDSGSMFVKRLLLGRGRVEHISKLHLRILFLTTEMPPATGKYHGPNGGGRNSHF
jgi:hypothetical protein